MRYLVIGGWVNSCRDNDRHYVSAIRLVELYGVLLGQCVLLDGGQFLPLGLDVSGLTALRPRYDGDYRLPTSGYAASSHA